MPQEKTKLLPTILLSSSTFLHFNIQKKQQQSMTDMVRTRKVELGVSRLCESTVGGGGRGGGRRCHCVTRRVLRRQNDGR